MHSFRGARRRLALVTGLIAIATAVLLVGASPTSAASPQSHPIIVKPLFSNPQILAPGAVHFGCQSNPISGARGPRCYQPAQIQKAYGYSGLLASGVSGKGRTIVIVDAFSNPYVANDLAIQDATFGLPAPPSYKAVAPQGVPAFDPTDEDMDGWAEEITLDVLWSHAMAPGASIVLVEAKSDQDADILSATKWAIDNNVGNVISQSFSEAETCVDPSILSQEHAVFQEAVNKGMTLFASSGDSGASQLSCDGSSAILSAGAPASDPLVTGVGGTTLNANDPDGAYLGETAWTEQLFGCNPPAIAFDDINCSGGGFSTLYSRPSFQETLVSGGSGRGVPDVSYDAGVNGGVLTHCGICNVMFGFDPSNAAVFFVFGGTSSGSPQWAALTADAQQLAGHPVGNINPLLYQLAAQPSMYAADFHDVTTGNNDVDEIGGQGYNARTGWDPVTGLGTPNAANLLPALGSSCFSATVNGPLSIGPGQTLCVLPGSSLNGPVSVNGGTLIANGVTIHGPVNASGNSSVTICGSTIAGPLSVSSTTGLTLAGGGADYPTCAGNTISGPASFSNNTGLVEFNGNTVSGPLSFTHNTGGLHQSGNTVSGPTTIH